MRAGATFCLLVYAGAAWSATLPTNVINLTVINDITRPFFGVPLTVLAMAATGALIGAGYTEPVESRKKLYTLTLANTLFAAWFVVLIPEWRGWSVSPVALPPLAGVIAAINCVFVPAMFKRLPSLIAYWLDHWPSTRKDAPPAKPGGEP
jgi:hypothetical protein